jgi:serine protease
MSKRNAITGLVLLGVMLASASAYADGPPTRIIVKWRDADSATSFETSQLSRQERRRQRLEDAGLRVGARLARLRTLSIGAESIQPSRLLSRDELRDVLATLKADPDVEYVEEDAMLQAFFTPNDTRYNEQWHYYESTGGLRLPAAWDRATGTGVNVAVLDTGYRPHADLAANVVGGYDMISDSFVGNDGNGRDSDARDPGDWNTYGQCSTFSPSRSSSWHGTHVAGTIAAVGNNGNGVIGVAYRARVVPVRVLGRCGGLTSDIADGVVWAAGGSVSGVPSNPNPAKVISLSLGGSGSCSSAMQSAINLARSRGATVVVAAGNNNGSVTNINPANCSGVVAVAATNRSGGKASYSNYGSQVDVAAPGGQTSSGAGSGVLSTLNSGSTTPGSDSYAFYQGTSMATPHVSGVVALMLSVNASLSPDQIESTLRSTARPFPQACSGCGTGIVDANAAVAAVATGPDPDPEPEPTTCAAGFTTLTGSLSSGASAYLPGSSGYAANAGTHSARLTGPSGTNFNLYLERRSTFSWYTVNSATGSSSTESIDHASAYSGTYRWRVASASGSGAFTLCTRNP